MAVPAGARGKPGLIALLQRVRQPHVGRVVLVRTALGPVQALNPCAEKVFAWQVVALSGTVAIHGKPEREFAVADECLVPLAEIDAEVAEVHALEVGLEEFHQALKELGRALQCVPPAPQAFERDMRRAAAVAIHASLGGFIGLTVVRGRYRRALGDVRGGH